LWREYEGSGIVIASITWVCLLKQSQVSVNAVSLILKTDVGNKIFVDMGGNLNVGGDNIYFYIGLTQVLVSF
jgi:hypothetical protein